MLALLLSSAGTVLGTAAERSRDVPIDNIVVIFLENHTFDNLYGKFPDANNLDQAGAQVPQADKDGVIYQALPQPFDDPKELPGPTGPDQRFPAELPNAPFRLNHYVALDQ